MRCPWRENSQGNDARRQRRAIGSAFEITRDRIGEQPRRGEHEEEHTPCKWNDFPQSAVPVAAVFVDALLIERDNQRSLTHRFPRERILGREVHHAHGARRRNSVLDGVGG